MKRHKTPYPGVLYQEANRIGAKGLERIYYIVSRQGGKVFEEKAGRQFPGEVTISQIAPHHIDLILKRGGRQFQQVLIIRKLLPPRARIQAPNSTNRSAMWLPVNPPALADKIFFLCQFRVWFYSDNPQGKPGAVISRDGRKQNKPHEEVYCG